MQYIPSCERMNWLLILTFNVISPYLFDKGLNMYSPQHLNISSFQMSFSEPNLTNPATPCKRLSVKFVSIVKIVIPCLDSTQYPNWVIRWTNVDNHNRYILPKFSDFWKEKDTKAKAVFGQITNRAYPTYLTMLSNP